MENDLYENALIQRRGLTQADLRITMLAAVIAVVLVGIFF